MLKKHKIFLTFIIILVIVYVCKRILFNEDYLTASIVTQHQGKEGVVKRRMLSHFKGEQDDQDRWNIEPIDEGIFDERDVVFMANHYKSDEGKELMNNFLENPDSFPTHMDIERAKTQDFDEFGTLVADAENRFVNANAEVDRLNIEIQDAKTAADNEVGISTTLTQKVDELETELREAEWELMKADEALDQKINEIDSSTSANLAAWLNASQSANDTIAEPTSNPISSIGQTTAAQASM